MTGLTERVDREGGERVVRGLTERVDREGGERVVRGW